MTKAMKLEPRFNNQIWDQNALVGQGALHPVASALITAFASLTHANAARFSWVAVLVCGGLASVARGEQAPGVQRALADGGTFEAIMFYLVAGGTIVCGAGVCLSRSIVRMAVWLFGALGSVALLYFLLAANFLGAVQLIVYAGGTLVLLIFGVMLTSKSPWVRFEIKTRELVTAGAVCVILAAAFTTLLTRSFAHTPPTEVMGTTVHELGVSLLTTYLVPFEVASVLLLVVMIGAAHLARQEKS